MEGFLSGAIDGEVAVSEGGEERFEDAQFGVLAESGGDGGADLGLGLVGFGESFEKRCDDLWVVDSLEGAGGFPAEEEVGVGEHGEEEEGV